MYSVWSVANMLKGHNVDTSVCTQSEEESNTFRKGVEHTCHISIVQ